MHLALVVGEFFSDKAFACSCATFFRFSAFDGTLLLARLWYSRPDQVAATGMILFLPVARALPMPPAPGVSLPFFHLERKRRRRLRWGRRCFISFLLVFFSHPDAFLSILRLDEAGVAALHVAVRGTRRREKHGREMEQRKDEGSETFFFFVVAGRDERGFLFSLPLLHLTLARSLTRHRHGAATSKPSRPCSLREPRSTCRTRRAAGEFFFRFFSFLPSRGRKEVERGSRG